MALDPDERSVLRRIKEVSEDNSKQIKNLKDQFRLVRTQLAGLAQMIEELPKSFGEETRQQGG